MVATYLVFQLANQSVSVSSVFSVSQLVGCRRSPATQPPPPVVGSWVSWRGQEGEWVARERDTHREGGWGGHEG